MTKTKVDVGEGMKLRILVKAINESGLKDIVAFITGEYYNQITIYKIIKRRKMLWDKRKVIARISNDICSIYYSIPEELYDAIDDNLKRLGRQPLIRLMMPLNEMDDYMKRKIPTIFQRKGGKNVKNKR